MCLLTSSKPCHHVLLRRSRPLSCIYRRNQVRMVNSGLDLTHWGWPLLQYGKYILDSTLILVAQLRVSNTLFLPTVFDSLMWGNTGASPQSKQHGNCYTTSFPINSLACGNILEVDLPPRASTSCLTLVPYVSQEPP